MKTKLIIIILLIQTIAISAQKLQLADNATSEIILRKHLKARFFEGCNIIIGNQNPDSILHNIREHIYGDFFIRLTIYAFGDWALKPDYKVYKMNIKSQWKGYEIYKLVIPQYSPRNDSIAAFYGFRDRFFHYEDIPGNPLRGRYLIAYNHKTGMMFYLDWPGGVFFHWSTLEFFKKKYPKLKWDTLPDFTKKPIPLISPKTKDERKKLLASELMKNIYSYRIIKSGILDSLIDRLNHLKDNVEQFPLIDNLLPDFDENLFMEASMIYNNDKIEYWRFEYPGYDSLYNSKGGRRNRAWEKYMPLKKQYYVVGYDLKRELIHFISGNFYLTRFADYYFSSRDLQYQTNYDSLGFAWQRICFVNDRLLSYFPDNYEYLIQKRSIEPNGEDNNYWYYILHSAIPYNRKLPEYDELTHKIVSYMCCLPPEYRFCDYKVRMSKTNWEIVEIVDTIKCFDK